MFYKTEQITIKVNPVLKDKFVVAIGFRNLSDFFTDLMQREVRQFEKDTGFTIPTRNDKDGIYDIITKMYGIKLSEKQYNELKALFPKTRKNIAIRGDLK